MVSRKILPQPSPELQNRPADARRPAGRCFHFRSLAVLGLLNGLLRCGLIYVALAGAVSRGSIGAGLGYMVLFGLGTLPMMLAASLSGKLFPPELRRKLNGAIPLGVCLLATLLILRGMALGITYVSPDLNAGPPSCCVPAP